MTLSELKELFEEITGRHDLVSSGATLNATWFINKGIRWLEKTYPLKNTRADYKVDLAADNWYVRLNNCQAVYNVYVVDGDGRTALTLRSKEHMYDKYGEDFSNLDTGAPVDYCPTVQRDASSTQTSTYEDYSSAAASMKDYNGLVVLPPADTTYTIIVDGDFFSEELVNPTDSNFWSQNAPLAVALAASLMLDKVYRNREGAAASKANIYDEIEGDLKNIAWEEAANAIEGNG